jgi:NADP-reducing hydrogenase subunit HndB
MEKLKSQQDFLRLKKDLLLDKKHSSDKFNVEIRIAMATCSIASGSKTVMDFFSEELEKRGINATVIPTGCMGYCFAEPTVEVTLPGKPSRVFGFVDVKKADLIIEKYIKTGELVDGLLPLNYEKI